MIYQACPSFNEVISSTKNGEHAEKDQDMNLEKKDISLETKEWCINNLLQYTKRPIASTRNEEHTPASFCKESDNIRFLNSAPNGNVLFAILCSAVENLELRK